MVFWAFFTYCSLFQPLFIRLCWQFFCSGHQQSPLLPAVVLHLPRKRSLLISPQQSPLICPSISGRAKSAFRLRSCGQNRNIFRSILLVDFSSASFSKNGYIQQSVKKGRFRALRYTADFALFTLYTTKSLSGKCNKSLTSLFLK